MKLIVERWTVERDPITNEEVEVIQDSAEVRSIDEARELAEKYRTMQDTVRVTLHYCYHDEDPSKPCIREEI